MMFKAMISEPFRVQKEKKLCQFCEYRTRRLFVEAQDHDGGNAKSDWLHGP
jgi:hypothetical protein